MQQRSGWNRSAVASADAVPRRIVFEAVERAKRYKEYVRVETMLKRTDQQSFLSEMHISVIELDGQQIVQMVVHRFL